MRRIPILLSIAGMLAGGAALVATPASAASCATTACVPANASYPVASGVTVQAGDTVTITAINDTTLGSTDGAVDCVDSSSCNVPDPNGVTGGQYYNALSGCYGWSAAVGGHPNCESNDPTAQMGALVYSIGDPGLFSGTMKPAGASASFVADKAGQIYLAFNDIDYNNNHGGFDVTITDTPATWDGGLVQNGSFETNPVAAGTYSTAGNGSSALPGWAVGPNGVDVINGYGGATAYDGNQFLDLSASDAGSVSQSVPTVQGASYRVTYEMSQNPAGSCGTPDITAAFGGTQADGTLLATQIPASWGAVTPSAWVEQTLDASATTTSTLVSFTSNNHCSYGPLLDAVSVVLTQQPTYPSNLALGALGNKTFGAAPFTVAATSDSPQPISYSATGPCTVGSSTGLVSLTGAGLCQITASQPAQTATATLDGYTAGSVQRSFTVYKATASIQPTATTMGQLFTQFFTRTAALRATFTNSIGGAALSGLPVSFTTSYGTLCRTTTDGNGLATCPITTLGQLQQLMWAQTYRVSVLPNGSVINGGVVSNLNVDPQTLNVTVPLW